ncbi:uncharacterized protein K460DRAFT_355949 [Cucurbitaria berberidis CBS 394.84]|uniref:Uncharacterized protein n=1 Tax=Cucurbitaria berberidis CBS 394.84 TaxID=1168544 RepID=A0A9P4L8L9_9PLEO|nr:uncharacterized protein K460DRAFT_355949 [Cucurbitaria berberidis CBS 394.84]KAF1846246.1 hypothetical protein K460DRAFT_355949 [Cucurbitaria berberidis CBS 394.84]
MSSISERSGHVRHLPPEPHMQGQETKASTWNVGGLIGGSGFLRSSNSSGKDQGVAFERRSEEPQSSASGVSLGVEKFPDNAQVCLCLGSLGSTSNAACPFGTDRLSEDYPWTGRALAVARETNALLNTQPVETSHREWSLFCDMKTSNRDELEEEVD